MSKILIGNDSNNTPVTLSTNMINRHGLIAGATGTGKTVTLKILVEQFSKQGIPVVIPDVKGDLSGLSDIGQSNKIIEERKKLLGLDSFKFQNFSCEFWDIFGKSGLNFKTTVSEIGPLLLSRIIDLNSNQESLLLLAFKIADDHGLLLLDTKDIISFIKWLEKNSVDLEPEYGKIATASIRSIQRKLLVLEDAGANLFLGEPAIDIKDLMRVDESNRGYINILNASQLIHDKRLYTTCLLYLLSELFSNLEEVGDQDKPKLVFFFDEAHLLFNDAPKELLNKVEQVIRLIRSKGVGVFFITQNPGDIPDNVLGQLGNRFQHALRGFTPKEIKNINAAASTFRTNPEFDTKDEITKLGIGEALVSVLDDKGMPTVVAKTVIRPPESSLKPINQNDIDKLVSSSKLFSKYSQHIDRESAHEVLQQRAQQEITTKPKTSSDRLENKDYKISNKSTKSKKSPGRPSQSVATSAMKATVRAIGTQVGRSLVRGILGALFKK